MSAKVVLSFKADSGPATGGGTARGRASQEATLLRTLLRLQELDLQIETCRAREIEIPKQKNKFDIYRSRLRAELEEREQLCQNCILEQRECESEIEQKQTLMDKYQQQLNGVKKNEEYQALIHEIDLLKKQVAINEERILNVMIELDDAKARLEEDTKRIADEITNLDRQATEVDEELAEAVRHRKELDAQRGPLVQQIDGDLIRRYAKIRSSVKKGPAVVPMNGEVCEGCHMYLRAQIVNEVLAGDKIHACAQCGRLLYHPDNFRDESVSA